MISDMEETKPVFNDISELVTELPDYPVFDTDKTDPMEWLSEWIWQYSRTLDISRGFLVNRCALYWAGYDHADGIDGQAFVDSCQDNKGSLRQLAQILDTDLQIFELAPHTHSKRNADELALAASYGMMAIEEGTQLFCTCSFGQGVETASVEALNAMDEFNDLESFMSNHCGLDHAAMLGAAIAGLLKGIPVILEGQSGRLVKSLLEKAVRKRFDTLILTDEITLPINHHLPGHAMVMTAIMLKTLYAASDKTNCGKIKSEAA